MNRIKEALIYIGGRIRDFGQWIWELEFVEKGFFTLGLVVLLAAVFGAAKVWNIAISDVGYYDNFGGDPDFMITCSNTLGYTICWTKAGSANFDGCVDVRKR